MIGLKRGTVELLPHQKEWEEEAKNKIELLKQLLGNTAIDIQHVGSSAIFSIHAKPIIDLAVAVNELKDVLPYVEILQKHDIIYRGEILAGEVFFVIGNEEIRTHHIHVVKWNGKEWNNYINFRNYLNTYPEKAMLYDSHKQRLAQKFSNDRKSYTKSKETMIQQLLLEANNWNMFDNND
ncbi:GrpB family protein [Traorella massiliensis]|uniref:GrpB family protein n=1 Tax=Traorella massiliensis TaxID=1903263 RepID=UPI0008F93063|nr:GrpB family protein [Traorella massiliensis]